MKSDVDAIVAALPPPGKGGDDEAAEGEYSAEEDAAMAMAKAMGISADKVDVQALCSAMRDFQATTSEPLPEE